MMEKEIDDAMKYTLEHSKEQIDVPFYAYLPLLNSVWIISYDLF